MFLQQADPLGECDPAWIVSIAQSRLVFLQQPVNSKAYTKSCCVSIAQSRLVFLQRGPNRRGPNRRGPVSIAQSRLVFLQPQFEYWVNFLQDVSIAQSRLVFLQHDDSFDVDMSGTVGFNRSVAISVSATSGKQFEILEILPVSIAPSGLVFLQLYGQHLIVANGG